MAAHDGTSQPVDTPRRISDQIEDWLTQDGEKTLGSLIKLFGEKVIPHFA